MPRFIDNKKKFTAEQKAKAVELYRNGLSAAEVAKRVGASAYSVRVWVVRYAGVGVLRGRGGHPRPRHSRRQVARKPQSLVNDNFKNYVDSQLDQLGLRDTISKVVKVSIEQKLKAAIAQAVKETLEALK